MRYFSVSPRVFLGLSIYQRYSGEEGGLRGSQDIATSYKNAGAQVKGMLQIDMSA